MSDIEMEQDMSDGSDYEYEEETGYQFDDEEGASSSAAKNYQGLQYEGNLNEALADTTKSALYPVYKALSKLALVEVNSDFYSAMLTMLVNEQILMLSFQFPAKAPFFPNAPPTLDFHSKFKPPHHRFNILFNCHPLLLSYCWNPCTDVVQIVGDLVEMASLHLVDTMDDDYYTQTGVQRSIIKIVRTNAWDVSELFPDAQMKKLPSFGITRTAEKVASRARQGTGYSTGMGDISTSTWNAEAHKLAKIAGVVDLVAEIRAEAKARDGFDAVAIDSAFFVLSNLLSRVVTMEEFFKNLKFYETILDCLIPLPTPSVHIAPLQSLMKLHADIKASKIRTSLDPNEVEVVMKLEEVCEKISARGEKVRCDAGNLTDSENSPSTKRVKRLEGSSSSSSEGAGLGAGAGTGAEPARVTRSSARNKDGESSSSVMETPASGSSSAIQVDSVAVAVEEVLSVGSIPRVVDLEEPFTKHVFLADMATIAHLPSKWYRRVHMELGSMESILPDNVVVFTGMQCSQPNLIRLLLFPESPDTPYCGGCFEFDVLVPADYPSSPPKVILTTTGQGSVRFNPNLYNCGKVCLSLLGTWSGEKWDPEVSSLSQVINSILFLIFVEHPYFNEPGYQASQGTPIGDIHSAGYNRKIRQGTLQFGYIDHFKKRALNPLSRYILPHLVNNWKSRGAEAAEAWAKDAPVLAPFVLQIAAAVEEFEGRSGEKEAQGADAGAGAGASADTGVGAAAGAGSA